jgi:hypothetical protein
MCEPILHREAVLKFVYESRPEMSLLCHAAFARKQTLDD